VAQAFVDKCILALNEGTLTAEEAAMAKWWCTELQKRAVDHGVQLHGGYGYMTEYQVERYWRDGRICEIYEGTSEVQKMVVAAQVLREYALPNA